MLIVRLILCISWRTCQCLLRWKNKDKLSASSSWFQRTQTSTKCLPLLIRILTDGSHFKSLRFSLSWKSIVFWYFLWGERTMQPRENHLIDWWLKPKSNTDNGETERTSCCGKTTHLRYRNDASGINTIVTILITKITITKITTRLSHLSHHPLALPRQTLPLLCFLVEGVWSD